MTELFVIAWTGGYEATSYTVKLTEQSAWEQARIWWEDADKEEDSIDVLRIDLNTLTMERLEDPEWYDKEIA